MTTWIVIVGTLARMLVLADNELDAMILKALRCNPDVVLAEAKVREAEAQVNQTKLRVTREVIAAYHEQQKQEQLISIAAQKQQELQNLVTKGMASKTDAIEANMMLIQAGAQRANADAEISYLLGEVRELQSSSIGVGGGAVKGTGWRGFGSASDTGKPSAGAARPRPAIPEKYRDVLELPVSLSVKDVDTPTVIEQLQAIVADRIHFFPSAVLPTNSGMAFNTGKTTLRLALEMFADYSPYVAFVFKDYGIVVTSRKQAQSMNAATIPADIPLILDTSEQ